MAQQSAAGPYYLLSSWRDLKPALFVSSVKIYVGTGCNSGICRWDKKRVLSVPFNDRL